MVYIQNIAILYSSNSLKFLLDLRPVDFALFFQGFAP